LERRSSAGSNRNAQQLFAASKVMLTSPVPGTRSRKDAGVFVFNQPKMEAASFLILEGSPKNGKKDGHWRRFISAILNGPQVSYSTGKNSTDYPPRNTLFQASLMPSIKQISSFLDAFAPTRLAEEWDNVGLLVGDPNIEATRVMTCLTITPESAAEAIDRTANLIVTHHPLPFRPLKRLTTDSTASKLLWDLIRAGVSIYSPHTGFDSAAHGINQSLAERLRMSTVTPLVPIVAEPDALGAGRIGNVADQTLLQLIESIRSQFQLKHVQYVGELSASVCRVAIACGSGGSFLEAATRAGVDTFVTGEATFHTCLEASANNISLVLLGHYPSERFALEELAVRIKEKFTDMEVWCSQSESDPVEWI
jgi:dinuclear metal center YbgI/SA1388 family protein